VLRDILWVTQKITSNKTLKKLVTVINKVTRIKIILTQNKMWYSIRESKIFKLKKI